MKKTFIITGLLNAYQIQIKYTFILAENSIKIGIGLIVSLEIEDKHISGSWYRGIFSSPQYV